MRILIGALAGALLISTTTAVRADASSPAFQALLKQYVEFTIQHHVNPTSCFEIIVLHMAPLVPRDASVVPTAAIQAANRGLNAVNRATQLQRHEEGQKVEQDVLRTNSTTGQHFAVPTISGKYCPIFQEPQAVATGQAQ